MDYEIIQTFGFKNEIKKNMIPDEDVRLIELQIMANPQRFPVIAGTNGLRKMRFSPAAMSTGKSGGIRVCYFVMMSADHIYLVTMFGKNEKDNLDATDKRNVSNVIKRIKDAYQSEKE